jgi:hydrogenase nickel incorporation protein HypB
MVSMRKSRDLVIAEKEEILDVEVEEDLLKKNEQIAKENQRKFDSYNIKAIDIMGAVGSGKTALIEKLSDKLKSKFRLAMIAGDVTTTIDADRVRKHGIKSIQINTGKECHLDANLIRKAISHLDLSKVDVLFIENVGNLICPADFKLGAHKRIVVISVTEGEYMVIKHPLIFTSADIAVINKIDLAEIMGVNPDKLVKEARRINPKLKIIKTSVKNDEGIDDVIRALNLRG